MPFSVSKKQKELNKQERARSSRIRKLLSEEPEASKFFEEKSLYLPPQETDGKFTPQFEFDREAVINKAIIDNEAVDSKDYHKRRNLNPIGQAAAAGVTEETVSDPELKKEYRKIKLFREKNK